MEGLIGLNLTNRLTLLLAGIVLTLSGCDSPLTPPSEPARNEPDGFSVIVDRAFHELDDEAWEEWGTFSIVFDPTAPRSPLGVGQILYPVGCSDSCDPGHAHVDIRSFGRTRLYVSFWVKASSNWQSHTTGVNKLVYVWMHSNPVVFALMHGMLDPATQDTIYSGEIWLGSIPDTARNLHPNLADGRVFPGRWHRWEILLIANTGDERDGEVHWWIDGAKVGEYRDVEFGIASQSKIWQWVAWRPIWGGRGDTLSRTMSMWMDHLYASGAP